MNKKQITGFYYITHINNIISILKNGIFSHEQIIKRDIQYTRIYDAQIVSNRGNKQINGGKNLWNFANVYFQPRNPMLYRVIHEKDVNEIAVICINPDIINRPDIYITNGNAANNITEIYPSGAITSKLTSEILRNTFNVEWWTEEDGSKRTIMAECLIPDVIPAEEINSIYVANAKNINLDICQEIDEYNIPIIAEPNMFFLPAWRRALTPNLSLVKGDMFFSKMQTFTVSVNTVGVMGKGLASRAKYQFPDVYVRYQDLCREKKLKMGKPILYKRESSLEEELSDDPKTMKTSDIGKWFLFFPTKTSWKENADPKGIEEGLQWLLSNYKKEGIKSLAIPALGCGLGNLSWNDIGPLMCNYLNNFDINVSIYLPTERDIPEEHTTKEFLLGRSQ